MKPLFTQEEFKNTKSKDKLPCECYQCGNTFLKTRNEITRCLNPNTPDKGYYCSSSCAAKVTGHTHPKRIRNKHTKICIECENKVKSSRHIRCEYHHSIYMDIKFNHLQDIPLKIYWQKDSLKNQHPSSRHAHIRGLGRNQHKLLLQQPCANCNYDKHVELCHIKPISSFTEENTIKEVNATENVIQLCRNCHWELDHGLLNIDDIKNI